MENAFVLELAESKFKDLYVCFCGYAKCEPLHSYGPGVRSNYLIHYIVDGKGLYQSGEKKYELEAGEGFLIEPNVLTYYQADKEEPWSYLWIGFSGKRAAEYLEDLGLGGRQLTFHSEQGRKLKELVLEMMSCSDGSVTSQYRQQSLLYAFFAVLAENAVDRGKGEPSKENFYMERAVTYIRNRYSSDIKVTDIADYLCVNRSYLYKLFKNTLHMSPQEFLTEVRLSRARELLTTTKLSIEHVALSCGYGDALVFSKAFKRNTGCVPKEYRKENWKAVKKDPEESREILRELMNDESLKKLQKKQ
ncbi:MAG: AraC family transcriptional regulator [Lachnospiraceae bacterium]|jgi:AraC-like DNA-binding protein|uniref:AraC family transcriptional regulator n=1 Tax=Candidatus Merdisoma sp. JLR.KK006 TaxID=3112626 RepID=UPI002FF38475|nr:AraC family transcriptional regulator [Lachnospiraceae bacterium]